jgi:PRC-barrel domain protein
MSSPSGNEQAQGAAAGNEIEPAGNQPGRAPVSGGEEGEPAADQVARGGGGEPASPQEPTVGWNAADWQGKTLVDQNGEKIGKLQEIYVDVETDEPQFGTVKEGFIGRHLTFVPLAGVNITPDHLQVPVTRERVQEAPNIERHGEELSQADESSLYHHYELNYTPPNTESGRRLARR